MRITLNDTRPLAVTIVDPANGHAYNPTSGAWEPFDPTKHLTRLAVVAGLPPSFAGLQTVVGLDILLTRTDCVAVVLTVDAAGQPVSTVDVYPSPAPFAYPTFGGIR